MPRVRRHRRFTANHTWHVDCGGHRYFVKANPHPHEARAERVGHARLKSFYPVPKLHKAWRLAGWTVLVYDRWPHLGPNTGLLLDEIVHADLTRDARDLDACLTAVFAQYQQVITRTMGRTILAKTVSKLYGERVRIGGRLDRYYGTNGPWPIAIGDSWLRPSDVAKVRLVVNGRESTLDFDALVTRLRAQLDGNAPAWAAITQGDPTDVNIGWEPKAGPVWFDHDTGGLNALPGEFACFLLYQRLHGAWLTPRYNPAVFRDHPLALDPVTLIEPVVHVESTASSLVIDHGHAPSLAHRHVMRRYLDEVVRPIADNLGIDDLVEWLRPYMALRLLAVYSLADLRPHDAALSLALLAEVLDPAARLHELLALAPAETESMST